MKYYGVIGYAETAETAPGVWTDVITEREYYGDILQLSRRVENSEHGINDNVNIQNKISIVCDPYALNSFMNIRYITWLGKKWKVSDVDVELPRLIFTLGGLYNDTD